jgi:hypothetical protein
MAEKIMNTPAKNSIGFAKAQEYVVLQIRSTIFYDIFRFRASL